MPFDVPLSRSLHSAGWRAKVYDDEGPETPHVTIRFKTDKTWKVSLRDGTFVVPPGGRRRDIPAEIWTAIEDHWEELQAYWDGRNPYNPIESGDDDA
jgi:hypothetical protein